MQLLINAFGANNYSSCVVIRNHILNLNYSFPSLNIVVFAARGSLITSFLQSSPANYTYILFPSKLALFPLRVLNEFILLPLCCLLYLARNSALATFSGYPILLSPIKQIVYFQNPMPYIYRNPTSQFRQVVKQSLLLQFTRFLSLFISSKDLYLFNSRFMMSSCLKKLIFIKKPAFGICFNAVKNLNSNIVSPKIFPGQHQEFSIISIAPFERYKNNHLVFEAFISVAKKYPSATLTHVGPTLDSAYFEKILSTIPIEFNSRIHIYTDRVSDEFLAQVMKSASLYCSASNCESFGLPAVESQAYGVPSVIQPSTAAAEIAGNGGIICDYSDRDRLCSIINHFEIFPSEYYNLSLASLGNYKKFSSASVSDPLASLINKSLA